MKFTNLFLTVSTFLGGVFYQQQITVQPIQVLTPAQIAVLNTLEVVYIDDCQGGPGYKTLRVKDANLQVVNGTGSTTVTNGLGNLIVGYNEVSSVCSRDGSHNVVVGVDLDYTAIGGIVQGQSNALQSSFGAILAGDNSQIDNNGMFGAIVGGNNNLVSNDHAAIIGGQLNLTTGQGSVVTGGENNLASGSYSTVSGGNTRTASGVNDWVAGTLFEDN